MFTYQRKFCIIDIMNRNKKIGIVLSVLVAFNFSLSAAPKILKATKSVTSVNKQATGSTSNFSETTESMSSLSKSDEAKLSEKKTALKGGSSSKDPAKLSSQKISLTGESTPNGETHLTVRANVSGASVYVDGSYAGKTPVTIKTISAGAHTVKVEADGYETATSAAFVVKGRSNFCYVYMERNKGVLDIRTNQDGCLYYCDGIRLPTNLNRIEEGVHRIKVRKFGYRDFEAQVRIEAFRVKRIYVNLEEAPFEVTSLTASRDAFNPNYRGGLGKCVITGSVTNKGSGSTVITNEAGKVVAKKEFKEFTTWDQVFNWDGCSNSGDKLPAGKYKITFSAAEYKLSVNTRIDYTLTYYLYDFADGGLGIGTVPVALSVPASTTYVGGQGRILMSTKGNISNLPVGGGVAYAPFKGFDVDLNFQYYPLKEPKIIEASDGAEEEIPIMLIGGSARYVGKLFSVGPLAFNLGGSVGYGYSNTKTYSPYGIADGRGLNLGLMFGLDTSMLFAGFTSQYFMGAETSNPIFGDNTFKNSLAVMFKPLPEVALSAWGSIHSANGYYNFQSSKSIDPLVTKFEPVRAVEMGAEGALMIPGTSLYVTAGGLLYCYPRKKIYYGGMLGIKYIF